MADSYHIIDGQVVPYYGGRKGTDTDAWRDATPLELQLQEQLAESERATAAQAAEIEALRAERDSAMENERIEYALRGQAEARAERLAEALRWYVDNDDTNDGQAGNEFWITGRERARALLRDHEEGK